MLLAEVAGQVWETGKARGLILSTGATKRWRKWFVEQGQVQGGTPKFMWYTALSYVTGMTVLMSDVEEAWDMLDIDLQEVLDGYFAVEEVGVIKQARERTVLLNIKDRWDGLRKGMSITCRHAAARAHAHDLVCCMPFFICMY